MVSMGWRICRHQVDFTHGGLALTAYVLGKGLNVWIHGRGVPGDFGLSVNNPLHGAAVSREVVGVLGETGPRVFCLPMQDPNQVRQWCQAHEKALRGMNLARREWLGLAQGQAILQQQDHDLDVLEQRLTLLDGMLAQGKASESTIRKQVYDLQPEDLAAHAVWEFCLDEETREGQDEATVRPYPCGEEGVHAGDGMLAVRCEFRSADGRTFTGYYTPVPGEKSLSLLQPVIVTDKGQAIFWFGMLRPDRSEMDRMYALLQTTPEALFPLRFTSKVQIQGSVSEGMVEGFGYLEGTRIKSIQ